MKKIILLSAVLAALMIACKKKKDDAAPAAANNAPSVSITNPENNSAGDAGEITITANASDADGSISKVEFYDGATKLGEDVSSPYSLTVTMDVGAHSLTAKAYDDKNASTTSAIINYTANAGPVIMQPAK